MAITPLPALDRASATFRTEVDTIFGTQLPTFSVEVEAARVTIVAAESAAADSAVEAAARASDAAASQIAASASAAEAEAFANVSASASGAAVWVTGTSYAQGDVVFSPANFQTYRRKTNGAGAADPSMDPTNWAILGTDPGLSLLYGIIFS